MSKTWPIVYLEKLLIHRKEFIEIGDMENYKRCRVQLHAQGIILRDIVPGAEIKTKKQQVCKAGDFLVAEIDAKVGGFGIVPEELDGAIVSSHYFLFEIDNTHLDKRFLDYFIRTPFFREQVVAQGSTNYAAIRPKDVIEYKIPLPPLAEQQRVVAKIEKLAAKIQEAFSVRQQTIQEAATLVKNTGKLIFGLPNRTVGEIAEVTKLAGFEYTEYFNNAPPGEVIVIRAGNVRNTGLDISNAMTIDARISDKLPRSQLKPMDVVMTFIGAKIGDVTFIPNNCQRVHCGPNVAKLTPSKEIDALYLVYVLQSQIVQGQIQDITKKTAQPNLSMKTIRQLRLPVPPLNEQRRIVEYLDNLQSKVDDLKKLQAETQKKLDALMPSILDRAFKGEL